MKRLRNTLYVTTPDAYLSLDGENIVLSVKKEERGRRPLHLLDSIIVFGHLGVSPALLGKCSEYLKSPPSRRRGLKCLKRPFARIVWRRLPRGGVD